MALACACTRRGLEHRVTRPPPSVNDITRMLADVPEDDSPLHRPPPEIELPQLREENRRLRERLRRAMNIVRDVDHIRPEVRNKFTVGAIEEARDLCREQLEERKGSSE